jgi:predicted phage replisome organizer
MRERKYVKFRVDMYHDTKFKIIDMKPERDLIHYVWTRFVVLAGKVNLEGDLYLSKNIPYTIETLAIEFNRGIDQIKLALDVLIELEMIEVTEGKIYRVKNFAKHQNIKVKGKIKSNNNEEDIKKKEVQLKENLKNEIYDDKDNESKNKINQNEVENVRNDEGGNLEIAPIEIKKVDSSMSKETINDNLQDSIQILLEAKRNKKTNKKKKKDLRLDEGIDLSIDDSINEEMEDNPMIWFSDGEGEKSLGEGKKVVGYWSF